MWNNRQNRPPIFFVLSAPSGTGKSSMIDGAMAHFSDGSLLRSISTTTRAMRNGESEDKDYYFCRKDEFEAKIKSGTFLEYAQVYKHYYGTSQEIIQKAQGSQSDIIKDLDVQGAKSIRNRYERAVLIFVFPPNMEILEERIRSRKLDDETSIEGRLQAAKKELDEAGEFDYWIVNRNLDEAVDQLKCVIIAERLKNNGHL